MFSLISQSFSSISLSLEGGTIWETEWYYKVMELLIRGEYVQSILYIYFNGAVFLKPISMYNEYVVRKNNMNASSYNNDLFGKICPVVQ